jgi:hypothetical protein
MEVAPNQQASIHISTGRGIRIMNKIQVFSCIREIISVVKRVEFVSDRMSYIKLRGHWCDIIVLNVFAPTEDKSDYIKDRFYEELEQEFDKLPKNHMKILLGDFNAQVGMEHIFKRIFGNESLREKYACIHIG